MTQLSSVEEYCPKRLRSADPDVKVIVGEKTFLHYSTLLCNCSDYFDAMLSSEMKEGQTKIIKFPDKDPTEWEQVYQFIGSPAATDLNEENLSMLVPWFSELRMVEWLSRSDRVLKDCMIVHKKDFDDMIRRTRQSGNNDVNLGTNIVEKVLDKVELCVFYELPSSLSEGLSFLDRILKEYLFFFDQSCIDRLLDILRKDAPRECLWPSIKPRLQFKVQEMEPELLIENPLLGNVLLLEAKLCLSRQSVFHARRSAGFTFGASSR